jgi:crossover junction endodeoxyribonuclease RuvC
MILGIDPSLRATGYGVIRVDGAKMAAIDYGVIRTESSNGQAEALAIIHARILALIQEHQPAVAAVEGVIYLQNFQTAITLGAARGAALLAIGQAALPVFEYAPRRVKAAATGRGGAKKDQVGFMIRALLGLASNPPADAADALAVAVTHAQSHLQQARGLVTAKRL